MAERTDKLHIPSYSIIQDKKTFCYGIDAVLLADFAFNLTVKEGASKGAFSVFDLGTGNGIIPLLIAAKSEKAGLLSNVSITGLELQEKMADMAVRSVELNGLSSSIKIVNGDIKNIQSLFEKGCGHVVVSNPPYMIRGKGRVSDNKEKMIARQELCCTLEDVVAGAAYLAQKFCMIHRPERLEEIFECLKKYGFKNITYQLVKPYKEKDATMVLIFALCDENLKAEEMTPLVIYEEPGKYTTEVLKIYERNQQHS